MQYDVNPSQDLRALSLTTDVKQVCSHSSLLSPTNYSNLFIGNYMALRGLVYDIFIPTIVNCWCKAEILPAELCHRLISAMMWF